MSIPASEFILIALMGILTAIVVNGDLWTCM